MDKVSLAEYWEMLNKHDWFHMYSDDNSVDRKGSAYMRVLTDIAGQSREHTALLIGFRAHEFSGEPWGTERHPQPLKPD